MNKPKIAEATYKLTEALIDLIGKYEDGKRLLNSGLCYQLNCVYKLPDSHSYKIIKQYPEWLVIRGIWIDEQGSFTERRYNFCKQLLADVLKGKHDQFFLVKSV